MQERPFGVTLLTLYHLLVGFVGMVLMGSCFVIGNVPQQVGFSQVMALLTLLLSTAMLLSSGAGMLLQERWGWSTALLLYEYMIACNASLLVAVSWDPNLVARAEHGIEYYRVKFTARLILELLLLRYLYRPHVRDDFAVEGHPLSRLWWTTSVIFGVLMLAVWSSPA